MSLTWPPITQLSPVLALSIPLPQDAHIAYAIYTHPQGLLKPNDEAFEHARRQILTQNRSPSLLQSYLPRVSLESHSTSLYVYRVCSLHQLEECTQTLRDLNIKDLLLSKGSSFEPRDLYPTCATTRTPCLSCLSPSSTQLCSSAACLLPREPLRPFYAQFLDAVRDRLIDDVCQRAKTHGKERIVRRLKRGFVFERYGAGVANSEWAKGWESHDHRQLLHCQFELSLSQDKLLVHPILRTAPYLPLLPSLSVQPVAGTLITLLPHAIPAYYLTEYYGPTESLTQAFRDALIGWGAGNWDRPFDPDDGPRLDESSRMTHNRNNGNAYIVAWIGVENKQGEEKGLVVVWPRELCLRFDSGHGEGKGNAILPVLPELPKHLQPSWPSSQDSGGATPQRRTRPAMRRRSSGPAKAFQRLSLGSQGIRKARESGIEGVAKDVGKYVDAVAKERERERERIRKEREMMAIGSPRGAGPNSVAAGPSYQAAPSTLTSPPLSHVPHPATVAPASAQQNPLQDFYPSPPMSNPPASVSVSSEMATSPSVARTPGNLPASTPAPIAEPSEAQADQQPTPASFHPTDSFPAEATLNDDLMDLGMNYSQAYPMEIDMGNGVAGSSSAYDRVSGFNYDDTAFTEDDFDFFDRPSTTKPAAVPVPLRTSGFAPAALSSSDALLSSSTFIAALDPLHPGQPSATSGPHSLPGTETLGEGFTPKFMDHHRHIPDPDLLPPSPGQTPPSHHSAPVTPSVRLAHEHGHRWTTPMGSVFDPILFANSHRVADGKYAVGKFALPSPPDEEDRTEPLTYPSSPMGEGWRARYNAATDPRIGLVRKLNGVKRKSSDQGMRESKMSPSWARDREDRKTRTGELFVDAKPENPDDDEIWDSSDIDDVPPELALPTPLPSYLTLGPRLLYLQFHHSHLLPLCSLLRPPGASITPVSLSTISPPINVPTPISPAATLGVAPESLKAMEATAFMMAQEVVENAIWREVWLSQTGIAGREGGVWQSDVKAVLELLADVDGVQAPIDLATLFALDPTSPLQRLETPMISAGKSDAIIQVLPSALRFWEKLGLGPKSGKKDVVGFVLFEADGEERMQHMEAWLSCVSTTYTANHLGSHVAGTSNACPKDGLLPLRFDSFRKIFASLALSLQTSDSFSVLYVIIPLSIMSLASPVLRQICTTIKRTLQGFSSTRLHVQFVPENAVLGFVAANASFEHLCFSVYDRILRPVDREMSRPILGKSEQIRSYFQQPSHTLARPIYTTVSYRHQTPAPTLDVVDRHTLLHIAYQVTSCGKWVLAAIVDQRGESRDVGIWSFDSTSGERGLVELVWMFILRFGKRANLEWRVAIAKLGGMSARELEAWMTHLAAVVPACTHLPLVHAALLSVEREMLWSFVAPQESTNNDCEWGGLRLLKEKDLSPTVFVDVSATTYLMLPTARIPLPSCSPTRELGSEFPYIPDLGIDVDPPDEYGVLPLSTAILLRVPASNSYDGMSMLHIHLLHTIGGLGAEMNEGQRSQIQSDIAKNYHELCILAGMRAGRDHLPWHISAVVAMASALGSEEVSVD